MTRSERIAVGASLLTDLVLACVYGALVRLTGGPWWAFTATFVLAFVGMRCHTTVARLARREPMALQASVEMLLDRDLTGSGVLIQRRGWRVETIDFGPDHTTLTIRGER